MVVQENNNKTQPLKQKAMTAKGKKKFIKCDVCGNKPFDIFFDSKSWNVAYCCKGCNRKNAKVGVLKRVLRLFKRILGIEIGFTC